MFRCVQSFVDRLGGLVGWEEDDSIALAVNKTAQAMFAWIDRAGEANPKYQHICRMGTSPSRLLVPKRHLPVPERTFFLMRLSDAHVCGWVDEQRTIITSRTSAGDGGSNACKRLWTRRRRCIR